MELHERISAAGTAAALRGSRDPFVEVKNRIHLALVSELGPQLFDVADSEEARGRVMAEIREMLQQEPQLSHGDRERLSREIGDDIFGYGPLEQLMGDASISEIMVNGHEQIWIEREGKISQTPYHFTDEAHLRRIITKMVGQVGRRIDEASRWSTPGCLTARVSTRSSRPLAFGALLTVRRFRPSGSTWTS